MISKLLKAGGITDTLLEQLNNNKISVFGCSFGEKLTIVNESGKFLLFVCHDKKRVVEVADKLAQMHYRVQTLTDDYNYDNSTIGSYTVQQVLSTLINVSLENLDAVVVTPNVLSMAMPNPEYVKQGFLTLSIGDQIDVSKLSHKLTSCGYSKVDLAVDKLTYALRGEIIDLCTLDGTCYRVMLDYDTVQTIRTFNPVTMLTNDAVDSVELSATKFLNVNDDLDAMCAYNIPFATNMTSTICDYVADGLMVIDDTKACWDAYTDSIKSHNQMIKEYVASGNMTKAHLSLKWEQELHLPGSVIAFQHITNSNKFFNPNKVFNISCSPTVNYTHNKEGLIHDLKSHANYTIVLFGKSNEGANKLANLLEVNQVKFNLVNTYSNLQPNTVNIISKQFPMSAHFNEDKLLIVGSEQLFGATKIPVINANLSNYDDNLPQSGDIVVHSTYGVGKCLGIECLKLSGNNRDYVIVEYKGGDKLYLPVENLDSIAKYVGSDTPPSMNKLGSNDFVKTKAKVKGELKKLAFDLVALYKERESSKGVVYPNDDVMQSNFEDSFGYDLTYDQANAVNDIKADMTNGKIMDRLICGDVGFGKTEVALRAAFKTILAGKQVALMCPTTILSEQHYNTALVRMKNFGVNIQVLNRFKTPKQTDQILNDLALGKIDLIVGTDKLLGQNVAFKNLGLLILDEEQKFGVGDKEKIKNIKKNINVLTLSATPIPRTLNMSLSGIRDISVIQTPPTSRLTTTVQVVEYSDGLVVDAVRREINRGGQVLIIYNKVESIYNFASHMQNILGRDLVIDVAHGQMDKKTLEDAIFRLYNRQTQVFVSTTLIENGVDLPNANTLIVINADMLGLSQLYQLKGRIGRSDKQAYAYFTFDRNKLLNENAYKRLQAITEFTAMGSGFKIAMRDLEIRGAGNVLGAEQSGHMQKIGYAMYLELLNEAVNEAKGIKTTPKGEVRIETSLSAFIPTDYISSYALRLKIYGKISTIKNFEELTQVLKEIGSMCGEVPSEVINLCKIALIKNCASVNNIKRVVIKSNECYLQLADLDALSKFNDVIKNYDYVEYDTTTLPIINFELKVATEDKLDMLINFLLDA